MITTDIDAIIADYLHRLDYDLHQLPASRREQLVSEIADHLREARAQLPDQSEATVRNLLDRVGRPEDIAAEALADQTERTGRVSRRRLLAALVALVAAVGVALGVILAAGGNTTPRTPGTTVTSLSTIGVPAVTGMTASTAANELTSLGLKVSQASTASAVRPPGEVVRTDPASGTAVTAGTTITIFVSTGSLDVTVPQVTGMPTAAALAALSALGLPTSISQAPSTVVPPGQLIASNPPAGSTVAVGSTIHLVTSSGPR